jgi:TonB family protein
VRCASDVNGHGETDLLESLRQQLSLSRRVRLLVSDRIESPVSFGLLRPTIMLPGQSRRWNRSIMTDVLLHELCHIRRLDWVTGLLAYAVACVYWVNPLVWRSLGRLREECENSCDAAVLLAGRSDTDYAASLLGVATCCIHDRRSRNSDPLMQTMFDRHTLKTRISRVLEEKTMRISDMKREVRRMAVLCCLLSAGTLGVMTVTEVVSAQGQPDTETHDIDEEMYPIEHVEPVYPKAAADGEIEGWVQVRFTVGADGIVVEESVGIVDAEPAGLFNESAIAATEKFRFSPRIVDGEAVDVSDVQYVFRYAMSE